jgi:hypothetical protein
MVFLFKRYSAIASQINPYCFLLLLNCFLVNVESDVIHMSLRSGAPACARPSEKELGVCPVVYHRLPH